MTIPSPIVRNAVCRSTARAVTTLGLCALLIVNGVPPVALAAPSPARVTAQPRAFLTTHGLPLLAAARFARKHALLAPGPRWHGGGLDIQVIDAARFLEQGTFGPSFVTDPADPNYAVSVTHVVQDVGFEGWLQEQFSTPVLFPDDPTVPNIGTNYPSPLDPGSCDGGSGSICWSPPNAAGTCNNTAPSTCLRDNYTAYLLQNSFFTNALTGPDQLRQRVAWGLTQIHVISQRDIVPASWMVPYVQLFDRDAFGNFRKLLYDITVNPGMGEYLNMRGNTKQNVNENYAREILQLFSVGLNTLNPDGTLQLDGQGNAIPTYGQEVITNFARVFTGWNLDAQIQPGNVPNYRDPMIVPNENNHDTNPKTLLDYPGAVNRDLPGGQDALTELNLALDNIFNHPNLGPFIGKLLIQKLVTSNPSPAYVQNVTNAFNTGTFNGSTIAFGSGQRGDMQAVIAAILLDPEARNSAPGTNFGHLREPVLLISNTLRALGIIDPFGSFTTDFVLGDSFLPSGATHNLRMDQDVFRPPTVFSYYPPDNQLSGTNLIAPEFGIQSTSTSLARINFMRDVAFHQMPTDARDRPLGTWVDTTQYEPEAAGDATALVNDLNNRLMHGTMTDALRAIVLNAVTAIADTDPTSRVQEAIYLISSSSQYQVER
jgi:uncharacterized protein (DUF1800 family)